MIWLKLKGYMIALAGILAALAAAVLYGRAKGRAAEQVKTRAAQDAAATAQAIVHAHEVRNEVELETAKLPDAPIQKVADADSSTVAGHLRDDGWVRPEGSGKD